MDIQSKDQIGQIIAKDGILRKYKGFMYIVDSVYVYSKLWNEFPYRHIHITREVYEKVAAMNHIKPHCVEWCIRSAISASFRDGIPSHLNMIVRTSNESITNSSYIVYVHNRLRKARGLL